MFSRIHFIDTSRLCPYKMHYSVFKKCLECLQFSYIVTEKDVIVHIDCLQSATIKMKFMLFQFNLESEMW